MIKKITFFVLLLAVAFFFVFPAQQYAPVTGKSVIGMTLADYRVYLKNNPPLDRLYRSGDTYFFLVENEVILELESQGFPFQVKDIPLPGINAPQTSTNGDYHSYQETKNKLYELAERFPNLARVFSIGQTIEGREIYVVKISDNAAVSEAEPNVFIMGCHHAREWISVEMPLLFAQYLLENYPTNAGVRRAVEGAQVYILPIVNPDGLEFSIHYYRMWRKNRRYNGDFCWGVDVNRNYGYKWGYDDIGSSPSPISEAYRGADPFSEPETRAIKAFLIENPPVGALSYHNYGQQILYPWGYIDELTPDDAEMEAIAEEMSELIFQVNGRGYTYGPGASTIYLTNGDSDDWIYATFGAFAFTIELPPLSLFNGGFITSEEEIALTFAENLPAMIYFVNYYIPGPWYNQAEREGPIKSRPTPGNIEK